MTSASSGMPDHGGRGRRAGVAPPQQVVDEAADDDRQPRQRRQNVVVELRDRQRHDRIGRHEPDRAEPDHPLAPRIGGGVGAPHDGRGQRGRGDRDPGQHGVSQLADEVLERAAIAVTPDDQAPPVVVAVKLVPERLAVAHQHRVMPGNRHHRAGQQRQQDARPQLRAPEPAPVPGEPQVGQKDDHGQRQPGDPLAQRRQPAQRGRHVEVKRRLVTKPRRQREERDEADDVRDHHETARQVELATAQRERPAQLRHVDDELRQRDHGEEARGHIEDRVPRPGQRPAPDARLLARQRQVLVVEQRQRAQRQRHRHGADERHVRHRLPRDQAVKRRGPGDQRRQHAGAPADEP